MFNVEAKYLDSQTTKGIQGPDLLYFLHFLCFKQKKKFLLWCFDDLKKKPWKWYWLFQGPEHRYNSLKVVQSPGFYNFCSRLFGLKWSCQIEHFILKTESNEVSIYKKKCWSTIIGDLHLEFKICFLKML